MKQSTLAMLFAALVLLSAVHAADNTTTTNSTDTTATTTSTDTSTSTDTTTDTTTTATTVNLCGVTCGDSECCAKATMTTDNTTVKYSCVDEYLDGFTQRDKNGDFFNIDCNAVFLGSLATTVVTYLFNVLY